MANRRKARQRQTSAAKSPVNSRWNALVESYVAKGKTMSQAIVTASREQPGLREAMVADANGRPIVKALYAMESTATNELHLFGEIDENSAYEFKAGLAQCDRSKPLTVRIDSPGGSVGPAISIFDAVQKWPANTIGIIESNAYSCGSYIAMACKERHITANALMMIHAPYLDGDQDFQPSDYELIGKMNRTLAKAYASRCRGGAAVVNKLMNRPEGDAWLDANEALQLGFATKII